MASNGHDQYLQAAWPSFLSIMANTPDAKRGPKTKLAAAPQLKYASLRPSSSRLYLIHWKWAMPPYDIIQMRTI